MAPKPWGIDERNAPSPRAYLAIVDKWTRELNRWTMAVYADARRKWEKRNRRDAETNDEGDVLNEADAAEFAGYLLEEYRRRQNEMPPLPKEKAIRATGAPIAKNAVRKGVDELVKAGIPQRKLDEVIGVGPPPPPGSDFASGRSFPTGRARVVLVPNINLVESGLGKDVLAAWAADGLKYIEAMNAEVLPDINERVVDVVAKGLRWETMEDELLRLGASNRAHARLIAQDQVARLNGKITEDMHRKAGITKFVWRASYDSRTRPSHREANGKTFTWAEGAPGTGFYGESGVPGQAGRCRCTATPVPPDWWNDV